MKPNRTALLGTLPYGVVVIGLLAVPVLAILQLSLQERSAGGIGGTSYTLANYARLLEPYYLNIIWQTVKLPLVATFIELVLAFPVAYMLARGRPGTRKLLTVLVMVPLMSSVVVKTFGWYIAFGADGPFTHLWRLLGSPMGSFLGTYTAVIVGMVEFGLPFMIFSLSTAIEKIPRNLEEAAANLYASPWQRFVYVLLPLSRAGIFSGFLLCFGVSASAYVVPALLGGTRIKMAAQLIYDDVFVAFNWPGAAAVAIALLVLLSIVLYLAMFFGKSKDETQP